jgi:hypothetical protein
MEKCELQRMFDKLFEQFESCKTSSIDHLQSLESLKKKNMCLLKKLSL